MSLVTRIIHRLIAKTKTEEFFVWLRRRSNLIRELVPVSLRNRFTSVGRLIPHSSAYPKDDVYFLIRDNTHFRVNRSDYVQWRIFYGVRDNALREAKKYLTPNSVVLDIGANIGGFSLKLARFISESNLSNVHIHAFEPNPQVFENYKINLSLNSELTSIIQLHQTGLGNETGTRSFQYDEINTGAGRVVQKKTNESVTVNIQRLDDFYNLLKPQKIIFIKLIVEGFEPEVLKGGWETIRKHRPPIFLEVTKAWWEENNAAVEETLDKLQELGYQFTIEHFNEMLPYVPSKYIARTQFNLMATCADMMP